MTSSRSLPPCRAVVLARGLGKRMREEDASASLDRSQAAAAERGVKAMIPIGRPFLDYVLSALADAGCSEVCLVIGPEHAAVRDYYTIESPPRRVAVSFAIQPKPLGTADAVLAAEPFAAGGEFLVINSDNYYPVGALRDLCALGEPGTALFEREGLLRGGDIEPDRVRSYSICEVDADGYLAGIVEKPDDSHLARAGPNPLVSMNCWRFSSAIFAACRETPLSPRGEKELPRAVSEAIHVRRIRLRVLRRRDGVLDLSRRADIAAVAGRLRGVRVEP